MIKQSALYLLAGLAARAAGFVMIPFYSSHLSPAEYGIIELIELATQVVSLAIGLNIFGSALIRIFQGEDTPARQNSVASTAVLATFSMNAAGLCLAVLLAPALSRLLFPAASAVGLLRLTLVSMLFGNLADLCLSYVRLKERALLFVLYSVISLAASVGLNVYFIGYCGHGVLGFVESKLIVTGTGSVILAGSMLRETGLHWDMPALRCMTGFGAPLILANVAFFAIHFGDRFFLSRLGTLTDVGNYALAYKAGFLVSFLVAEPFSRAWNVRYVALMRAPGWEELFRSASRFYVGALVIAGLAISLFSDELLPLIVTPAYYPAAKAIPLIAAAYVLREIGDFFRNMLYVKLRSGLVGMLSAATACFNFLLNWLWIPGLGMMGAAWATLATWGAYALALYFYAERDLEIEFPRWSHIGFLALGAGCFAAGAPASALPPALRFCWDAALLSVFCALAWKSTLLTAADRGAAASKILAGSAIIRQWRRALGRG